MHLDHLRKMKKVLTLAVLILIVMEYALRFTVVPERDQADGSLNPYCNGICT